MVKKIKELFFRNTSTRQTVAKNSFWLTVSQFGGRLLKAVIIVYAARVLGAAGWGIFSYAVTLAGFFTLFMDLGINAVLMRDASKAPPDERIKIFSAVFALKILLIALGVATIIFAAPRFSTLPGVNALLPIAALVMMFDTIREFFSSLIRSLEKMEWEAGISTLTNGGIVVFGFIFLYMKATPVSFGWGYVAGTAAGALTSVYVFRSYFRKIFSNFSANLLSPIIRAAWPFAITGVLGMLLTNTDILIIGFMRTAAEVGVYSAAIRVAQLLYLIPVVLQFSLLPLLSRLANKDDAKLRSALERTLRMVFLISIPAAVGGAITGTGIMGLLFGKEFLSGGLSLKILMVTMLVDYPATIISSAIFAYDHQKSLIRCSVIGGVSNVILDLLLIPPFGITGSAVATLLAQSLSNAYLWRILKRINYFSVLPHLARPAIAAVAMGGAAIVAQAIGSPVMFTIILSAIIYGGMLFALKEPLLDEIKSVFKAPA